MRWKSGESAEFYDACLLYLVYLYAEHPFYKKKRKKKSIHKGWMLQLYDIFLFEEFTYMINAYYTWFICILSLCP